MAQSKFWRSQSGFIAICSIFIIGYFLLMEHRQHVFQALPFLIILLCPLMHIFMHGGHGGHGDHKHGGDQTAADEEAFQRGLEEGRKQVSINSNDSVNQDHH